MTDRSFTEEPGAQLSAVSEKVETARRPHGVEQDVRRRLLSHPRLQFKSLVVRRIQDGVCLQGIVETDVNSREVDEVAESVRGVNRVLNRLVVRHSGGRPLKG